MQLKLPLTETFHLESDPDGEATITIQQATVSETEERAALYAKRREIYGDGAVAVETEFNAVTQYMYDIALVCSDITGIVDEDGNPFPGLEMVDKGKVRRAKNRDAFINVLRRLPIEVLTEMHEYVKDVNPDWFPDRLGN